MKIENLWGWIFVAGSKLCVHHRESCQPLKLTRTVFILCLQVYNMFSYPQEHPSILTDSYSDYCTVHKSSGTTSSQTTLPPTTTSPFLYNSYSYAVSQPDVYGLLRVNLISINPEILELCPFVSWISPEQLHRLFFL